jgi:hypothetical protein
VSGNSRDKSLDIWNDGKFFLRYIYTDEFGFIYLWERDKPVATMYLHELLRHIKINAEQFISRISDKSYMSRWREVSEYMYEHRNDYLANIPYFMKRLSLCEFDAEVLSIHFTGMGPEAIAVKFGLSSDEVRKSFDRIMAAYQDSGIVVNDSIFTNDPMSKY